MIFVGLAGLCLRTKEDWPLAASEPLAPLERVLACDVRHIVVPDVGTVDALARFALAARRLGFRVRLEHASPELVELVLLAGLRAAVGCPDDSVVEARGQSEQREVARGVEEEDDPADPAL
jgi:hypothetical protein